MEATGAKIHVSREAGVAYEHEPLQDGDVIEFGDVRIRAMATPGHRPEYLSFTIEDASRGEEPWVLFTGDSLFVGDLARPISPSRPRRGHATWMVDPESEVIVAAEGDGIPDEIHNTAGRPLAVVCGSGVRSALAASLLKKAGIDNVEHVADGGVPMLAGEGIELVEGD